MNLREQELEFRLCVTMLTPPPPPRQVINAALTLAARPQSKVAQDNMDVFKDQWEKQVRILTEAVDDITSVDDFLSVSGLCQYSTYFSLVS